MSDDCNQTPFWQRQPRLPLAIHRFLQDRMEAALQDPEARQAHQVVAEHAHTEGDAAGWRPGSAWGAWGPLVSLRCGWQLAALTPLPLGERYPLACGVSLFNHGLYHECHDALEPLWAQAEGELKQGLQGLILLASG